MYVVGLFLVQATTISRRKWKGCSPRRRGCYAVTRHEEARYVYLVKASIQHYHGYRD